MVLTIGTPWVARLSYIIYKHWRVSRGYEYRDPVPGVAIFLATIVLMRLLVKCNLVFGSAFYK